MNSDTINVIGLINPATSPTRNQHDPEMGAGMAKRGFRVADDVNVVACHPARSPTLLRGQRRSSVDELAAIAEFYSVFRCALVMIKMQTGRGTAWALGP